MDGEGTGVAVRCRTGLSDIEQIAGRVAGLTREWCQIGEGLWSDYSTMITADMPSRRWMMLPLRTR